MLITFNDSEAGYDIDFDEYLIKEFLNNSFTITLPFDLVSTGISLSLSESYYLFIKCSNKVKNSKLLSGFRFHRLNKTNTYTNHDMNKSVDINYLIKLFDESCEKINNYAKLKISELSEDSPYRDVHGCQSRLTQQYNLRCSPIHLLPARRSRC